MTRTTPEPVLSRHISGWTFDTLCQFECAPGPQVGSGFESRALHFPNFELGSDNEDDTSAVTHYPNFCTSPTDGYLALDGFTVHQSRINGGSSVESGFEPVKGPNGLGGGKIFLLILKSVLFLSMTNGRPGMNGAILLYLFFLNIQLSHSH
ncbi:hypothetical protein AVEN_137149-1 [Araneus ventricosus]|uniref:Uncharacterized protein n=1 Tax=Araneus ventricosus TaxID=182803 RepID=A0A4Y2UXP3_ARAVE|nr:hypothetical protein AVEN_137149-1 [Araneus ventricosus]